MARENVSKNFIYFNIGMLFSSIGSMTFLVTAMAYMTKRGFNIADIGLFVGCFRFVPTLLSVIFSKFFLKMAKIKFYIPLEIASFFLSLVLASIVMKGNFNIYLFTSVALFRAILSLPQKANRPSIIKHLESSSNLTEQRPILWLNKMTHGATFFSALISLSGVTLFTFPQIILFDGVTFLISALFSYGVIQTINKNPQPLNEAPKSQALELGLITGIKLLLAKIPGVMFLDFLLATIMIGANMFSVRIAGKQEILIPLLLLSYGLAVWVGGFLIRIKEFEKRINFTWIFMMVAFALVGFIPGQGIKTLALTFVCDLGYWLLFHFITEKIQNNFSISEIENVHYSRNTVMMLYLALGEFAVGGWASSLPLHYEGIIRGSIAIIAVAYIWNKNEKLA